jgi:acyl-CoA thioesterase I
MGPVTMRIRSRTMTLPYRVSFLGCKSLCLAGLLLTAFAAPLSATAAERLILAFGDSLTAGYQLAPGQSYPAQLETLLRKQGIAARVHNAGVSGDTSTGGRSRLGWVIGSLKAKPDLVILCLGGNDSLRGIDPAFTRTNLDAMLTDLRKRNIRVLLAGMLAPPNMGKAYAGRYNAIFPELAKKYGTAYYPFLLDGVAAQPGLLLEDGIHPNTKGAAIMAKRLMPPVRKLLERP